MMNSKYKITIKTIMLPVAYCLIIFALNSCKKNRPVWKWSTEELKNSINNIRAGEDLTPKSWPGGARVAIALSFDVDLESVWMSSQRVSPSFYSRGEYGARVGIVRILSLLEKYDLPASFFVPAINVHLHPDVLKSILSKGLHEIAFHSWAHEDTTNLSEDEERLMYQKGMESWLKFLGKNPVGVRTASWDFTHNTAKIFKEFNFLYDSSLMSDDRPFMLEINGQATDIVELPVEWINDDWTMFQIDWQENIMSIKTGEDAYTIWASQFDQAYEDGTMFSLTCHPQVIGHGYRIKAYEKLLKYILSKPNVWFATHEQIALYVKSQHSTPKDK